MVVLIKTFNIFFIIENLNENKKMSETFLIGACIYANSYEKIF